ncbi:ArsR/SmtB family transcription factor [Rubidibacter lacunae]|uniref:ArsR/SmtB family transcription factor n=1 Tax=Rubidibacter lacunae TaxID=582514 RepID=UPI001E3831AB|nr:metalloregulator ArsR/SmtB family transcription factor [Rubidibacter lacunae]
MILSHATAAHAAIDGYPEERAVERATDVATDKELAELCKALGHPARVQILRLLMGSPCICGDVVQVVGLAQSTVSEHLRVLKQVGLIRGEVDGPRVCYCVDPAAIERFRTVVTAFVSNPGLHRSRSCC